MSDPIKPTSYPEKAAFQLIVELIRADKIPMVSNNITNLLSVYDQAVAHFKGQNTNDHED